MDKETETLLDTIAQRAAVEAVAKSREFHQDDLKVLGERMDIGFESVNRRIDGLKERIDGLEERIDIGFAKVDSDIQEINNRLDQVENALATLLTEFKLDREKQTQLEAQIVVLTERVTALEKQLQHA